MKAAIKVDNVTKQFGSVKALDSVSLNIPSGQIYGFLGPNGAGKTTMIRCLMDYMRPTTGTIQILGRDAQASSAELKKSIGYLSSDIQLHSSWTAQTHLDFYSSFKGLGRAKDLVKLFRLDTSRKIRHLSSGNKQKLSIILAFLGNPKLLIMDEPTRGLDPLLQNQLYELLRSFAGEGGTVFLSSHNLAEAQALCDGVAVIKAGKIVAAESINDILQLHVHNINAVAGRDFKRKDFDDPDIEIVDCTHKTIALKVKGDINPALKKLSGYRLSSLDVSHASLEDVFMEYY